MGSEMMTEGNEWVSEERASVREAASACDHTPVMIDNPNGGKWPLEVGAELYAIYYRRKYRCAKCGEVYARGKFH